MDIITSLALVAFWAASTSGQERVHSDLPLFSNNNELWPRGFMNEREWGCASRIPFGDWKYAEAADQGGEPLIQWLRLENYGVHHCAVVERWAGRRENLGNAGWKHSWFIELGRTKRGDSEVELWALQSGTLPGSDYLLLARKPEPGLIKTFDVLRVECPRQYQRKGDNVDVWRTDYCAINSASELRSFARAMALRPAAGTLTLVAELPDNEEEAEPD